MTRHSYHKIDFEKVFKSAGLIGFEIVRPAPHARAVAKAVLGRGLGQLLEANRGAAPSDGNPVEERRAARMGMGVRSLLTSSRPADSVLPEPEAARPVPRAASRAGFIAAALIVGDVLLCGLAIGVLGRSTTGLDMPGILLGLSAIAAGGWMACEAVLICPRVPLSRAEDDSRGHRPNLH